MKQDEVKITASLACAYFHPGSAVRGCLEIRTPKDLYVEAGAVQLHGHISVDADLLTVPIVTLANLDDDLAASLELPDVRSFSGQTGTCIYQSKPSVLFSDTDVHESLRTHFAVGLPNDMCPTFKGPVHSMLAPSIELTRTNRHVSPRLLYPHVHPQDQGHCTRPVAARARRDLRAGVLFSDPESVSIARASRAALTDGG